MWTVKSYNTNAWESPEPYSIKHHFEKEEAEADFVGRIDDALRNNRRFAYSQHMRTTLDVIGGVRVWNWYDPSDNWNLRITLEPV